MLHEFLTENRDELILRCRTKAVVRRSPARMEGREDPRVPRFFDQLIGTLRGDRLAFSAGTSGLREREDAAQLEQLTVDQVVRIYGDVCQSITDLAVERNAAIEVDEFRTLNKCLDDAISAAVTAHAQHHDQVVSHEHTERLGILAHELRNLINSANLAFVALASGTVGIGGSTGDVLGRCLRGLRRLVDRSLTEVRLGSGTQNRTAIRVSELLDEVRVSTLLETSAAMVDFSVPPVDATLVVEADRQTLASILANLVQNAFKFSKPGGHVTLTTRAVGERVLIEVADECGGLPPGKAEDLFRPFEQRGADRSGLGLGLAICVRGAEANGGTLQVRDVPGTGCVFTLDLPRQV
jgi:hypothetical protein